MKSLLKYPAFNAICVSLFSAFYGYVFIFTAAHYEYQDVLYYIKPTIHGGWFMPAWAHFLELGGHGLIAIALLIATAVLDVLLLTRRRLYDEYHTAILSQCLSAAIMLMILAVAVFYLAVLSVPNGIVEKFTLFISIHWVTVVCSEFAFVLKCRWS
ncbi:MAG: hypothetical protein LBU32_28915 [Clostridiales bacterium]|jgi:hypothetical protein|nr:hypothetical protein [Clostridiales bacterium]